MKARAKKCISVNTLFALLTLNLLVLGKAEYVHRHRDGIQSKIYEHPRFGESSIRYCAFNQYFDDSEGRCMIIPGGGIAISIDASTTCSTEALRGHPLRSRNYYVCRETNTILAECTRGKRFDNRLKRCAIDARSTVDEEDYDSHHHPYDHLHLPACQRSGRFPVPQDNCTSYYSCTSNGFRFFRTIHKCPASTGFDPLAETCTIERACADDNTLESTTVADDRSTFVGSPTFGLIVTPAAGQPLHEPSSIATSIKNYSVNNSSTRFSRTTASYLSSKSSSSRYDGTIASFNFTPPDTFGSEKLTTFTSLTDLTGEVVGIESVTRPSINSYERSEISTDNKNDGFGDLTTIEDAPTRKHDETRTSGANELGISLSVSSSTESAMDKYSNKWLFDKSIGIATSTIASAVTEKELGTSPTELLSSATSDVEASSITTSNGVSSIDKSSNSIDKSEEASTPEITTLYDDLTSTTPVDSYASSRQVSWSSLASDEIDGSSIGTTVIVDSTSVSPTLLPTRNKEATRMGESNWTTEEKSTIADREHDNFSSFSTYTTDNEKSTTVAMQSAMSTTEPGYTSAITEKFDSTSVSPTLLTTRNEEATHMGESNWTTEEKSTIADREHDTFSSFSTYTTDNEKSTTVAMQSAMSTTEPGYISAITEKFDSTSVSPTLLTTRNEEATRMGESNWTTEEKSTRADRDYDTFSSLSTYTADNEKSTIVAMESAMSTREPGYISAITEKFDSTLDSHFLLTTRDEEATSTQEVNWTTGERSTIADRDQNTFSQISTESFDKMKFTTADIASEMSTTEPVYISEVNEKFYSTPAPPTSLKNRNDEAISIEGSGWTTEEKSTIADRYHDTVRSFSTDNPDNGKSTTVGPELTMRSAEPAYIFELTEKAVTNLGLWKSSSNGDLFTSSEPRPAITGESLHPIFKYASTSALSGLTIAHSAKNSDPEMTVVASTTAITPSGSSEPSQLEQVQGSYTTISSASKSSEYPTPVEPSTGFTSSSLMTMASSD